MKEKILLEMQENPFEIISMHWGTSQSCAYMNWRIVLLEETYEIHFSGVYDLVLRDVQFPFQIFGFTIDSNTSRGWERAQAFTINDYEDDKIHFYCEAVDVLCVDTCLNDAK